MRLHFFACIASLAALVAATPNPLPGSSNIVVRDPAIWYNSALKEYFVFSTGKGFKIFKSSSLKGPWQASGVVLPNGSKIAASNASYGYWAPDINHIDGKYVLSYSLAETGNRHYYAGIATSPTMESGSWTDHGEIFNSNGKPYMAIDTNLFNDGNGTKVSYGSFINGMFQVNLDANLKTHSSLPGAHLAAGHNQPAEGGFLYKPKSSPYYYFFFSDGVTMEKGMTKKPAPGKEYKVLVGRGKSPQGPFVSQEGYDLTDTTHTPPGSLVLGSHDNIFAPGGQSVFNDPVSKRDVIVYHYVPEDKLGGDSFLGINFLDFSSGWPVVVA